MKIEHFETVQCAYCGMECFHDELDDDDKCKECIVEDCRHRQTYTEYTGDNAHRARFVEACIDCQSWREYKFYFTGDQARVVGPWRTDEVDA
jgi:hypothetical protein